MTAVTPFHPRTSGLNAKLAWGEWAAYLSPAGYADMHDIEYNAMREAAAVFDVSPLYKYIVIGARRRPARRPRHHPGRHQASRSARSPTPRGATRRGKVIDDGTVARLDETQLPVDGGRPAVPVAAA